MKDQSLFKQILGVQSSEEGYLDFQTKVEKFEKSTGLILPNDFKDFLWIAEYTDGGYNESMYRFFLLKDVKGIGDELKNYNGTPDYSNIVNTLVTYKHCYVFADYMFHMFSYAIQLKTEESSKNEIFVICGDRFKRIASSFIEFAFLYLNDDKILQFED